eukprot:CAMPEP_0174261056 /NCGR_PEP_ID=MMETSP0439-20130205/11205_1 /TAXON_ID=0 /ORGANISM="Stereomyxa ramosa, Strain Chinc5" /LENGTH=533 /DNA_ID=CAMNT_0015345469 /DNA_START=71 /DNA_END=1672 /DNA_ORIENTATION=-
MASLRPAQILSEGSQEEKSEAARLSLFVGATALSDLVKTTLGPKGMDKILQSTGRDGDAKITNDGATILKSIHLENPSAKVLVDVSKVQDSEVGDGTTSVCVLAGELLREAEKLIKKKLHPQMIAQGYRAATEVAFEALQESAIDNSKDPERFKQDLYNIAHTTLSSKILRNENQHFSEMAVNAVLKLKGSTDLEAINIIKKKGGSLRDSYLDDGFILEKKIGVGQPKRVENAKILLANTSMDNDKIKMFGSRVRVESSKAMADIEKAERDRMIRKCEKIAKHECNVFINRQLIYNLPEQFFADHGICAIEHADFEGMERLAKVLGAEIVSTFDNPDLVTLGSCDLVEEIMLAEDKAIRFSGVAQGEACTIILRGASKHMLDEAERSLHDALCVLSQTVNEGGTVLGAGCSEVLMAEAVDQLAARTPGKVSFAISSFAKALRAIPTIIADNAGYDSLELISQLKAAHNQGNKTAGLDMEKGIVGDARELNVVESFKVKSKVLLSAAEAAVMILRVDEIVTAPPRPREQDPRYG